MVKRTDQIKSTSMIDYKYICWYGLGGKEWNVSISYRLHSDLTIERRDATESTLEPGIIIMIATFCMSLCLLFVFTSTDTAKCWHMSTFDLLNIVYWTALNKGLACSADAL